MTKTEIIAIVRKLDTPPSYSKYYQFAHTYLRQMQSRDITDVRIFWQVIRHCSKIATQNRSQQKNTMQAMGISGQGSIDSVKTWCEQLLNKNSLLTAKAEDLCSIFGYCAHLGK